MSKLVAGVIGVVVGNAQVVDDFPLAGIKDVLDGNPLAVGVRLSLVDFFQSGFSPCRG